MRVEQLGQRAHAAVGDAVVAQVELRDARVVDEAARKHAAAVVVEHVARERQLRERLAALQRGPQAAAVAQLHVDDR